MRLQSSRRLAGSILATLAAFGLAGSANATICDTDPGAVDFEATVNPEVIQNFLAALGKLDILPDQINLTLPGLCTDHQLAIDVGLIALITDAAPFVINTIPGQITADVDLVGPYGIGIDGDTYTGVNCDSFCVVDLPYIGEVFDGCAIESGIVGPIIGLLNAGISWDEVDLSQTADTCVTTECEPVHPTTSTSASLVNYDVDLTGFGACEICINLPDPLPDLGCFDPCDGLDPILSALTEPLLTDFVTGPFVTNQGEGTIINAMALEIKRDNLCFPIPEVTACKDALPPANTASMVPADWGRFINAAIYLAPLAIAGIAIHRLRRRRS